MQGKKILLIGGSGSLGNAFIKKHLERNEIYVYSRDECKHWTMQLQYNNHKNLKFIIGNVCDEKKMQQTVLRHNFHLIINAAAMKHIDKCEYESNECLNTNINGPQNLVNIIENFKNDLTQLECVCFISTDKACSPVNIYGMSKAISESLFVEKSKYVPDIKFVSVRYGNVLNSRGSIIPMLHEMGQNPEVTHFKLTDDRMTRFVMTLEQSVELIEKAIADGESGDIVIPKLVSCKIKDLIEIFSEHYGKPIMKIPLRAGEKMLESLINETQSLRLMREEETGYMFIKPPYKHTISNCEVQDYNSKINPLTKFELRQYLYSLNLISLNEFEVFNGTQQLTREKFSKVTPFPYMKIENVLSDTFAKKLQEEILQIPDEAWDRYENPLEHKYTLRDKNSLPVYCNKIFEKLTSQEMLDYLSSITGTEILNDSTKNWWGIHKYDHGDNLDIHVDAGIHPKTKQKKQVTVGIYLSKDWKEENGGHLEMWKGENASNNDAKIFKCMDKILPQFNTFVIFECNDYAWHGNPNPVVCKDGEKRLFLTLSYVSENYTDLNKKQKAFFVKRPEDPEDPEKDKIRMMRCDPDKYKDVYRITA
uniref:Polysaccharide biosynthesis protein CapD-like domain-containing protein n=1 Tax=viral metagenome TaxID=1070528 RepID=A0A6C0FJA8_9ZZZZ